jgi:enoyl-[acyl-carrier-protein] reductase (NADH)
MYVWSSQKHIVSTLTQHNLPPVTRTAMISAMTNNAEIEREMTQKHPLKRLGDPQDIANAAVFLASNMSDGITGLNLSVDGGLHSQLSV